MSLQFKRNTPRDYSNLKVLFEDTSQTSPKFFRVSDVPQVLTKGKNLLRISAHPSNLVPNSQIIVDIKDANGDPIYFEVPDYLEQDKSRVISIWIYHDKGDDNTANGDATITIYGIARVDQNGKPVPSRYRGKHNVKWSTTINVDRDRENISPVIFKGDTLPTISISESIEAYQNLPSTDRELELTTQTGGGARYIYKGRTPIVQLTDGSEFNQEMVEYSLQLGNFETPATPETKFENPTNITSYTSSIKELIDSTTVILNTPFTTEFDDREDLTHTFTSIESADYSISYFQTSSNIVTENQRSYANLTISNVNPISGYPNKLRVLIKSDGLPGDYELLNEVTVPFSSSLSVKIPIPSEHLEDPKRIKVQYLNSVGDISRTETITEPYNFEGGNYYFGGRKNLISGSMYISNTLDSGIELGGVSSGFIRSVGFEGQTSASLGKGPGGFIIYSGSGNLQVGEDVLNGVGLQLIGDNDDRHLIFTTDNGGLLDVKTDKFFIGTTDTQFISGSDGNIEISSSIFHLDPQQNLLVIGADAVINGLRTPATINGAPSTRNNSSSSIDEDGFARFVSASIGGWDVTETTIESNNLLLKSEGDIQTQNFVKGQRGWQISSKGNGIAEFENVKIRGTLGTTTFEKETVNAVGGQLYVANSTTLSGSLLNTLTTVSGSFVTSDAKFESTTEISISSGNINTNASDVTIFTEVNEPTPAVILFDGAPIEQANVQITDDGGGNLTIELTQEDYTWNEEELARGYTITFTSIVEVNPFSEYSELISPSASALVVKNATGWQSGEIITAKKIGSTGFDTEYMKIYSSSLYNISATDNSGVLFVTRSFGSSSLAASGVSSSAFLGDLMSISQSYDEGQVIASTGRLNTGYIRINANPSDESTPYIDIVERTGSGINDVSLKARLGDLSGLSGTEYVLGNSNPGFGLATDNVFLQGGIKATFGEIGGFSITETAISSSNNNLILRSNGNISALSGDIGGFGLTPTAISSSNNNLILSSSGQITALSGEIGGFGITPTAISSSNDSLILKSNGQITGSNIEVIQSGSSSYKILSTSERIVDASNIGKIMYNDSTFSKTITATTDYTASLPYTSSRETVVEFEGPIWPGETTLALQFQISGSTPLNPALIWGLNFDVQYQYISSSNISAQTVSTSLTRIIEEQGGIFNNYNSTSSLFDDEVLSNSSNINNKVPLVTLFFQLPAEIQGKHTKFNVKQYTSLAGLNTTMTTDYRQMVAWTTRQANKFESVSIGIGEQVPVEPGPV